MYVVGRQTSANTPALLEMARKSSSIARPKTLMEADKQFLKVLEAEVTGRN